MSTRLGSGFKIDKNGKIVADHGARLAKLDVATRLKIRKSKRVKVVRRGERAAS